MPSFFNHNQNHKFVIMLSQPPTYLSFLKSGLIILFATIRINAFSQVQQGDTSQFYSLLSGPEAQVSLNYALLTASANGDSVQIWWLLRYGAEIETKTNDRITPLFYAVANNKVDAAKMLIDNGADPNARTNFFETPLLVAVKNNNTEIAELLIRDSAEVRYSDRYGATPLHYASAYGYFPMADMLLYYDAEVSRKTNDGTTPLMAAVWAGNTDVADLLLQNGAKTEEKDLNGFTSFLIAAQNGDTLMMDLLLKHGAEIYEVNKYKFDALDICIMVNSREAVKYLLKKGNKWGANFRKPVNPYSVATVYRRPNYTPLLKENTISGNSSRGFDQVSVSASLKNCLFDYYTGISVSFKEPIHGLGIIGGIDFKPGYTRMLVKQNENLFYQYYGKGAVVYAGIFKDFPLTDNPFGANWFFTGSLSGGYTFGNKLKGTDINPGSKFRIMPAAGFKWIKNDFSFDTSLEYMNTEFYKIGPIWLRIGCTWSFFFKNARSPVKQIKWF
jgi:ankyrin repeat protein